MCGYNWEESEKKEDGDEKRIRDRGGEREERERELGKQ